MVDRSTRREFEALAKHMQRCLRCVTDQPSRLRALPEPGIYRLAFLPAGQPARMMTRGREGSMLLRVQCDITAGQQIVRNPWNRAVPIAYRVDIGDCAFSYHWHPFGPSHVQTPHLHVKARRDMAPGATAIEKLHFPTGAVSLPAIIRFMIEEVGVDPNRADWERVLADAEVRN